MARTLRCPTCRCRLRLDESSNKPAGKCPACKTRFRIPAAASSRPAAPKPRKTIAPVRPASSKVVPPIRRVCCPTCLQTLRIDPRLNLRAGQCPVCSTRFRIPETLPPSPAAQSSQRRAARKSSAVPTVAPPSTPARSRPQTMAAAPFRKSQVEPPPTIRRFSCPTCRCKLRLNLALNLRAGQCPACLTRFRIPGAQSARPTLPAPARSDNFDLESLMPPSPSARSGRQTRPPQASRDSAGGGSVYGLNGGGGEDREMAPPAVADFLPESVADVAPTLVGKRKRKQHKGSGPGMSLEVSNILITSGVLGFIWVLLAVFVICKPDVSFIMLLFGAMTYVIGRCWFLFIAWEEGLEDFLKCFVIPFYEWLHLYMYYERYGRAFSVRVFGLLILLVAGIVYHVTGGRTSDDDTPASPPAMVRPAPPSNPLAGSLPEQPAPPGNPPPGQPDPALPGPGQDQRDNVPPSPSP